MGNPEESSTSKLVHELKNPLMAIKGLAATGSRHYEAMSDDERREFFRLLDTESDRLIHVMEQAATALLAESGEISYDIRPEPLEPLIGEALTRASLGSHPVQIDIRDAPTALCDAVFTRRTLEAALNNAASFSPVDEPIEVTASVRDGRAVVEVADRGPGLSPEDAARAFDRCPGIRPEGYEEVPGAGLSLYLASLHSKAQGGSVSLERRSDMPGTIFRLTLEVPKDG